MSEGDLGERMRARGYRMTPQRELILQAVQTLGHATPDEVHAEVRAHSSAVNVSTVYRTLEVLEELDLVRHTHLSDRAPTYHAVDGPVHFHLVCRGCGRVSGVVAEVAEPLVRTLREAYGFEADVGHMSVFGRCTECDAGEGDGEHADRPPAPEQAPGERREEEA